MDCLLAQKCALLDWDHRGDDKRVKECWPGIETGDCSGHGYKSKKKWES